MADETKPVEIPQEETPVTATEAAPAVVEAPATEAPEEEAAVPAGMRRTIHSLSLGPR